MRLPTRSQSFCQEKMLENRPLTGLGFLVEMRRSGPILPGRSDPPAGAFDSPYRRFRENGLDMRGTNIIFLQDFEGSRFPACRG